jgi:hypothetical protein
MVAISHFDLSGVGIVVWTFLSVKSWSVILLVAEKTMFLRGELFIHAVVFGIEEYKWTKRQHRRMARKTLARVAREAMMRL